MVKDRSIQRRIATFSTETASRAYDSPAQWSPDYTDELLATAEYDLAAIAGVKAEGILRRRCQHRPVQYLNNILEQDHRAIKRRVKAKEGFRAFDAARLTIAGYEAMRMIRKGQVWSVSDHDVRHQNQFIDNLFDLAA